MKKQRNAWKTIAIIFIILFVLESALIIYNIAIFLNQENKLERCAVDICGYSPELEDWNGEYDGHNYDEYLNICYCFKGYELSLEKYMG